MNLARRPATPRYQIKLQWCGGSASWYWEHTTSPKPCLMHGPRNHAHIFATKDAAEATAKDVLKHTPPGYTYTIEQIPSPNPSTQEQP